MVKHDVRDGEAAPEPVIAARIDDWPKATLEEAMASGALMEASQVAEAVVFMLTRRAGMTIQDLIMPNGTDLQT